MGNFSNYWDLTTLFTKLKNKLKSISDKIDDSVSLKTATGNPITLTDAAEAKVEELSMTIEPILSGSGDPSPTNVRPISGLTSGEVTRTGKNILPMTLEGIKAANTSGTWSGNTYTINDVSYELLTDEASRITGVKINGTASAISLLRIFLPTPKQGDYVINGCPEGGDYRSTYGLWYGIRNESDTGWVNTGYDLGSGKAFSVNINCSYIRVEVEIRPNYTANNIMFYPMIRLATETDPTFEPYTATNATITFGKTVYGGSVNFKTGEVTVTHGIVDAGTLAWFTNTAGTNDVFVASMPSNSTESSTNVGLDTGICSNYKSVAMSPPSLADKCFTIGSKWYGGKNIALKDSTYTDAATFKTAMYGVQLCYELATPTTLTLTPAELELLKGNNTITANGAEISIEYYPDNAIGTLAGRVDDKADITYVATALAKKDNITTVEIPRFITSQAGWRRICKIKPVDLQTAEGMIYVGGFWSNGQPPSATVAVSLMVSAGSLTLLSSAFLSDKRITAMRLINATGAEFWLDAYFPAYSSLPGPFKFKFTGDIAVSDIQNPISITTDATAASAEISLNQKVSGTVLTDKSDVIANLVSGKADRFVSSSSGTAQTIDIGASTSSNRIYLLSAGYFTRYGDYYVFGLILVNSSGSIKYVSLKDEQTTVSVTYTDGIVSLTFSEHPYSKAVLIRLS